MRKLYDPQEYKQRSLELAQTLHKCDRLELSDPVYQRFGQPGELVDIAYLDHRHMSAFAELADFDCRHIKLVNFGRAAIQLSFFQKHKYFIDKKPKRPEVEGALNAHLETLVEQHDESDSTEAKQHLSSQITKYRTVLKRLDAYQFAFSNYSRYYTYDYVMYRYFVQKTQFRAIDSANAHLIKHTTNRDGQITVERTNVIFVDAEALRKRHSYDNKRAESFLAGFTEAIDCGKYDLYIR